MVKRKKTAGFTLMEAMLTVAILGIISAIGARVMIQANKYFVYSKSRADLQQEARKIMYIVTRELRQAQNTTITVSRADNSEPYCSLISFTKEQGNIITYYQKGNQLIMKVGTDKTVLTTHLTYLAFTFPMTDNMTIISVDMTLSELIYGGQLKTLHMASEKVQIND